MNWLRHPIADGVARWARQHSGGRIGILDADDIRQEGAIRAWQYEQAGGLPLPQHQSRVAVSCAVDLARRHGTFLRSGEVRPSAVHVEDNLLEQEPAGVDSRPDHLLEAKQHLDRLPPHYRALLEAVLEAPNITEAGRRMQPPVSAAAVSQMIDRLVKKAVQA